MTGIQQQLTAAGLEDTATGLEPLKEAAAAQVTSAAASVTQYVTQKGLGSLPVSDLSKLLASVQRLQQKERQLKREAAKAAAAQETAFAARGPLDSLTATGGLEELLRQTGGPKRMARGLRSHPRFVQGGLLAGQTWIEFHAVCIAAGDQ
jgi:hypothetical protein